MSEEEHRRSTASSSNNANITIEEEGDEKDEKVPTQKEHSSHKQNSPQSSPPSSSSSFSSLLSSPSPVTPSTPLLHGNDGSSGPSNLQNSSNDIYEESVPFIPRIHYTNAIYTTLSVYRLNTAMVSLGMTTLVCFIVFTFSRIFSEDNTQESLLSKPGIYELFASVFCLISVFLSVAFLRTNQRRIGSGASFFFLMSKKTTLISHNLIFIFHFHLRFDFVLAGLSFCVFSILFNYKYLYQYWVSRRK